MSKLKDLPKVDLPREKLLKYGPEKLTDTELLSILIRTGTKDTNVKELSRNILKKYSYGKLICASINELTNNHGIGKVKAGEIVACFELARRLLQNKKAVLVLSPKDVFNELKDIRDNKKEHFVIFYLDTRNQEIKRDIISVGTLNASLIHPREVFEPAIRNLAAQIIITHNHPSGSIEPSSEDVEITKRLVDAGKILGIEIIDHVIVAKDYYLSFKEKGFL